MKMGILEKTDKTRFYSKWVDGKTLRGYMNQQILGWFIINIICYLIVYYHQTNRYPLPKFYAGALVFGILFALWDIRQFKKKIRKDLFNKPVYDVYDDGKKKGVWGIFSTFCVIFFHGFWRIFIPDNNSPVSIISYLLLTILIPGIFYSKIIFWIWLNQYEEMEGPVTLNRIKKVATLKKPKNWTTELAELFHIHLKE